MDPLTSPDPFLRREAEDPRLLPPIAIVLVTAVLGIVTQYLLLSSMSGAFDGTGLAGAMWVVIGISAIFTFIGAFFFWLVYAGIFYVLSILFDGEGSFVDTLKLVGWGYVPSIVSGVVTAVAYAVLVDGQDLASPQGMAAFSQGLANGPTAQALAVLGIAITLWQGVIWAFAVKHGRNLSLKQATIVVGVPVGLSVAWSVFTLVSGVF